MEDVSDRALAAVSNIFPDQSQWEFKARKTSGIAMQAGKHTCEDIERHGRSPAIQRAG